MSRGRVLRHYITIQFKLWFTDEGWKQARQHIYLPDCGSMRSSEGLFECIILLRYSGIGESCHTTIQTHTHTHVPSCTYFTFRDVIRLIIRVLSSRGSIYSNKYLPKGSYCIIAWSFEVDSMSVKSLSRTLAMSNSNIKFEETGPTGEFASAVPWIRTVTWKKKSAHENRYALPIRWTR